MPNIPTVSLAGSSLTVGALSSDPQFIPTKVEVTLKDEAGNPVLSHRLPRTDIAGDTMIINLDQLPAARGVSLETALRDGLVLTPAVKALDNNDQETPEATSAEKFTVTPQSRIALMAFNQGAQQREAEQQAAREREQQRQQREAADRTAREQREREQARQQREQREREQTRQREADRVAREQREQDLRQQRDERNRLAAERQQRAEQIATETQRALTASQEALANVSKELRLAREARVAGGSADSRQTDRSQTPERSDNRDERPIKVTVKSHDAQWTIVVVLVLIFAILFGFGIMAWLGWLHVTPASVAIPYDPNTRHEVRTDNSTPPPPPPENTIIRDVQRVVPPDTKSAQQSKLEDTGTKAAEPHSLNLVGGDLPVAKPEFASLRREAPMAVDYATPMLRSSIPLGGITRTFGASYAYPAEYYPLPSKAVTRVVEHHQTIGYNLSSNKRFGVASDLVEGGGGGFYVDQTVVRKTNNGGTQGRQAASAFSNNHGGFRQGKK